MDKKEGIRNCCEHCLYSLKKYLCIGNKLIYDSTSACSRNSRILLEGKTFEEKVNCEHFTPNRIPAPRNDLEQRIAFVSRQIDELSDLLAEVLEKLGVTDSDVFAQEPTEENETDE